MIPWEKLQYHLLGQASNGEEGLNKIREWKPDVVITDIKMPKMDGLSMIKEAMKESNPPVFIVLSRTSKKQAHEIHQIAEALTQPEETS